VLVFLTQFLLDCLQLLAQVVLALSLAHLRRHVVGDLVADLQHFRLVCQHRQQEAHTCTKPQRGQYLLALVGRDGQMRRDRVR